MWNDFEKSKNFIKEYYRKKSPNCTLCEKVFETEEECSKTSTSRAKAESIIYILENAAVSIAPDDIFALKINHGEKMRKFMENKLYQKPLSSIRKGAEAFESSNTFKANMDFGHVAPDWQNVLKKGVSGIISELEFYRQKHSNNCEDVSYYDERIMVYIAIKKCFMRFAELAESRQGEKSKFIAQNLRHLAENPPTTLAQAMQLILLFYVIQTDLDTVTIRSLGGLDRMLYPFYKSDLSKGRYTKEQLTEITKYFLWEINCMEVTANLPFYICGIDENGDDATNEFTCFLLETYRELDIYDPKIHVMYHKDMNKKVLRLCLEMIREGKNSFVFINTPLASKALENIGVSGKDAKKVIVYGCYETAAEGTEIPCTCAGMINLTKAIEFVLKSKKEFSSFEDFYEETIKQLLDYTRMCMDTISAYEPHYNDICPSLIMSPTYKCSIESGVDVYSGGAKYNNTSIVGAGLATLVDSLVAVKRLVFLEKRLSLGELRDVLNSNWQQNETLRLFIKKNYAKFGNNQTETDELAVDIYNRFSSAINGTRNGRGGVFRCGMFSVDWRFWMGDKTSATPDGRFCGEPLSKNLAASIGQDKNGVTAYLQSVLKLCGEKCPDGYVADVVLHSSAVKDEEGMTAFDGLLDTFMKKGGFSVHFNVLSPEMLLNAQKEPEKYKNLQIRLCGWNVRFVDLDKAQQDEFIKQSANVM